jgi:predicted unusual protein kinase regulating ubiquinone biosynthesis (AarF/ABC1/UbiB family)
MADGREVAVKIQYPGVAAAVRADLKNLALILRMAQRALPGLDADSLASEIRLRIGEELDYVREAANQREFAAAFRDHPFIVVPDAISSLCGNRVLVTEFVEGDPFEVLKQRPAEDRNRVGEIIYRFFCGTLYRRRAFSGDPHPGNFLLQRDGRVAFFDFGLVKRMTPAAVELELACLRAAAEGRAEDLHRLMGDAEILPEPHRVDPVELLHYVHDAVGWYLVDEELELTPEMATAALIESAAPSSTYFKKLRHQNLPSEHALARRLELLTEALLGQLHARANWYRIASEWLYDEPPQTELGELEAGFYARRAP